MTWARIGERIHGMLASWAVLLDPEVEPARGDTLDAQPLLAEISTPEIFKRLRDRLLMPGGTASHMAMVDASRSAGMARRLRRAALAQFLNQAAEIELLESALDAVDAVYPGVPAVEAASIATSEQSDDQAAPPFDDPGQGTISEHPIVALRNLLDPMPMGIWAYDAEGLLVGMNPEAEWLHGKPASQLVGRYNVLNDIRQNRGITDLDGNPLSYDENPLVRAWNGETVRQAELAWHADGVDYYLQLDACPLYDTSGTLVGLVVASRDIAQRVAFERELERNRREAERISHQKSLMLAALSHDVRTPLNTVSLATALIENHAEDLNHPQVVESLRIVRHSIGNVLELLNEILDLSQIEAGHVPLTRTRFELTQALEECLASIQPHARRKGLDCELDGREVDEIVVETDRVKLKQIVSNLLSNALWHTDKGQIQLRAETTPTGPRVHVVDTGRGIAPHDQSRVFDAFTRVESPHDAHHQGVGLGLSIARRLADLLGARIELESTLGTGSRFTLCLPLSFLVESPSDASARA